MRVNAPSVKIFLLARVALIPFVPFTISHSGESTTFKPAGSTTTFVNTGGESKLGTSVILVMAIMPLNTADHDARCVWSAVLSGMMVITNITDVPSFDAPPFLTNVVIDPAGLNNVDSPLWQIVWGTNGINNTRANKNIFSDGAFTRIGDILRAPALTEQSPFINRVGVVTGDDRLEKDISDEQYEWLPQQMMGLLRCSTAPRYVIYCYGQTLKPSVGGTVLDGGPFFGLVTNYQVVAESATRAVLSVQPVVTTKVVNGVVVPTTNYTTRVESFNPLPPE